VSNRWRHRDFSTDAS